MLQQLDFKQFKALSEGNQRVVVSREIFADTITPVSVFQRLAAGEQEAVLLDSSDHSNAADACIYIGLEPVAEFTAFGQHIEIQQGSKIEKFEGNAFTVLRQFYNRYRGSSSKTFAKFAGGMIGYLAYDAIRQIETIPDRHPNEDGIPDICFKFYGTHIVFDKRSGKATVAKVVEVSDDLEKCYQTAMQELDDLILKIKYGQQSSNKISKTKQEYTGHSEIEVDIDDEQYAEIVRKAKQYIHNGDAFQIVASRRFKRQFTGDDFDIYRALRLLNPSPYQFYIRNEKFTIVGASPERLVSLQNNTVETMPIAGTRRRSENHAQDLLLENELLNDAKERAEHTMLVDLGRNDVGAICKPGTVNVFEFAKIKRFSRVMHMVSRIQGTIENQYDAFDVLQKAFPAGTLSGAPKIRAMEIIDEIETSKRGVYGGAICAIDNEGQFDSCITIRTALVKDGVASVRAGGGIVLDSDEQKEADETRHKAQAVLDALALAEGGL